MASSQLPQFQDDNPNFQLLQNKWSAILNPVIANPVVNGRLMKTISLKSGINVINHLLQRQMQGWFLVDQNASAEIYRSAPMNSTTLTLTASAPVQISLWVF